MSAEEYSMPETEASKEYIDFFVEELKSVYWAEKHFLKIFPKMHKAATGKVLKQSFEHLSPRASLQLERLEQVFELLGETPKAKKNLVIEDLLDDLRVIPDETEKGSDDRDTTMVLAAQKIASYEIANYANLVKWAQKSGNEDIISLLEEALSEAEETLETFSSVSEWDQGTKGNTAKEMKDDEKIIAEYDSVNLTGKNKRP